MLTAVLRATMAIAHDVAVSQRVDHRIDVISFATGVLK
jgi:hypothetical protein